MMRSSIQFAATFLVLLFSIGASAPFPSSVPYSDASIDGFPASATPNRRVEDYRVELVTSNYLLYPDQGCQMESKSLLDAIDQVVEQYQGRDFLLEEGFSEERDRMYADVTIPNGNRWMPLTSRKLHGSSTFCREFCRGFKRGACHRYVKGCFPLRHRGLRGDSGEGANGTANLAMETELGKINISALEPIEPKKPAPATPTTMHGLEMSPCQAAIHATDEALKELAKIAVKDVCQFALMYPKQYRCVYRGP